jgi:hypothetical protein
MRFKITTALNLWFRDVTPCSSKPFLTASHAGCSIFFFFSFMRKGKKQELYDQAELCRK